MFRSSILGKRVRRGMGGAGAISTLGVLGSLAALGGSVIYVLMRQKVRFHI